MLFGPVGRMLPFAACRPIGRFVGSVAWRFGFRRSITRQNLALALPDIASPERERIGRASLQNLATVFLEILTLRHLSDTSLRRSLVINNLDVLRTVGSEGALLLSGHIGNWELLAIGAAAQSGVAFDVVVKAQESGAELDRTRTSRGNRLIPTNRGAREATALLRRGGVVAMLADQSATVGEHETPMFGIPTYTYSAPARLALRFRPRVIIGFALRDRDGRYRVDLEELSHADLPDTPEGARAFTERYVRSLERAVRAHPEQWVWQHRKWKNTPGISYE